MMSDDDYEIDDNDDNNNDVEYIDETDDICEKVDRVKTGCTDWEPGIYEPFG